MAPRFLVDQPLAVGAHVELEPEVARHAGQVLRLRPGDGLVLFNGRGGEYRCRLVATRPCLVALVETFVDVDRESPLATRLVQGVSRGERMDYALQKAVELGVSEIVPVITARTQVRLDAAKTQRRLARWRQIVRGACEQSGRTALPAVTQPVPLDLWLQEQAAVARRAERLLLDPRAPDALAELRPVIPVEVLIGPEGGLSEAERRAAQAHGFRAVALGPRILRTETAAVAALAVLQATAGDARRAGC